MSLSVMQQQQQEVKLEIKLEEIKSEPIELEVLIEPSPHSPPPTPHKPYPLAISPATPATPEIPTSTHQHQTTSNYRHVKTCRVCGDVAFCKHQSLFGYSSHFVILSFVSFAKWNSIQLQWYQLRVLSVCIWLAQSPFPVDNRLSSSYLARYFFRRYANRYTELRCPNQNRCVITIESRRYCQRCRMVKCLAIGMRLDMVKKVVTLPVKK